MIRISALADEISPDLSTQIRVLQEQGIRYLELRGVWNSNVLDLSDDQVAEIKHALGAAEIEVSAIAAPIGKIAISSPAQEDLQLLDRAIELARAFGATRIRIFSFYPVAGSDEPPAREAVLARLSALTERARANGITLLHENEKGIYGDTITRCADLLQSIDDPAFRAVFDSANFLQCDQEPYPAAYDALSPWISYVHVKDVDRDGQLVVAGAGDSDWPGLLARLRADGYDGFFSLEPHLAAAGQFSGFSGEELFAEASQALQRLLRAMSWEYR